jgi:hypothetical protein
MEQRLIERMRTTGDQVSRQGVAFVMETRDASRGFFDHTREAAAAALGRTRDAGGNVVATVRSEAEAWREFLHQRRARLSTGVRRTIGIRAIEHRLLASVHRGLSELDGQVEGRLKELSSADGAPSADRTKRLPRQGRSPMGNYDSLTAREVVSKLDKLTTAQVQSVYDYERATKKRQTILRAAKQHLSN